MLDLTGHIVGMLAIAINLVAVAGFLPGGVRNRLGLAAVVGVWVGLASALAAAGRLAFSPEQPVPLIGVLLAVPLLTVAGLAWRSQSFRAALLGLPTHGLIALNSLRILGVLFLALQAVGRLAGPFPWAAGLGDILTGVLAIPLALRLARGDAVSASVIARWNALGAVDLVVAVVLGITSANGSPLQFIHAGVGSQAMQYLPFSLIPTVLVPFYLMTHATIAAQLHARRATAASGEPRGTFA